MSINLKANGNMPPQMDPDKYAQIYANGKGISVDKAKAELKAKYGEPQQPDTQNRNSIFGSINNTTTSKTNSTNPDDITSRYNELFGDSNINSQNTNIDNYIQEYADEKGLNFQDAKKEVGQNYGNLQKYEGKSEGFIKNLFKSIGHFFKVPA